MLRELLSLLSMRKLSPGCPRKQVTFTLVDIRRQERDFNKSVASLSSHFGLEFVTPEIFYAFL